MDLFNFDPATIFSFFLTLLRVSLILFLLPVFGGAMGDSIESADAEDKKSEKAAASGSADSDKKPSNKK